MGNFLLVVHWTRVSISSTFRDIWPYVYWGHDLDLSGSRDVISHVTIRVLIGHLILGSIGPKFLPPSVFEIYGIKHIGVTTLIFLFHVTSSVT